MRGKEFRPEGLSFTEVRLPGAEELDDLFRDKWADIRAELENREVVEKLAHMSEEELEDEWMKERRKLEEKDPDTLSDDEREILFIAICFTSTDQELEIIWERIKSAQQQLDKFTKDQRRDLFLSTLYKQISSAIS